MVRLVFGGLVVDGGKELFSELELRHVGVVVFLQAL